MCLGSWINWRRQKWNVMVSIILANLIATFIWGIPIFYFALRSPMTARMKALFSQGLYKISLRFFEKKIKFILVLTGWPVESNKVKLFLDYHQLKSYAFLQKTDIDDSKGKNACSIWKLHHLYFLKDDQNELNYILEILKYHYWYICYSKNRFPINKWYPFCFCFLFSYFI